MNRFTTNEFRISRLPRLNNVIMERVMYSMLSTHRISDTYLVVLHIYRCLCMEICSPKEKFSTEFAV